MRKTNVGYEKHGMSKTKFYSRWKDMKSRCHNDHDPRFYNYGGRGIKVCEEWQNSFSAFKKDMYKSYLKHCKKHGEEDTVIDKINNYRGYYKENCRWVTKKESANNRRRKFPVREFYYFDNKTGKFKAFIYVDNKKRFIGYFDSWKEVKKACEKAINDETFKKILMA